MDIWLSVKTKALGKITDVAFDNENLILFDSDDISQLASKIKHLILNTDLKERLSIASLYFAKNEFSLQRITSNLH